MQIQAAPAGTELLLPMPLVAGPPDALAAGAAAATSEESARAAGAQPRRGRELPRDRAFALPPRQQLDLFVLPGQSAPTAPHLAAAPQVEIRTMVKKATSAPKLAQRASSGGAGGSRGTGGASTGPASGLSGLAERAGAE
ncbi:MAG TPA: hypothetical protein PKU97_04195, partial [Kofleriaceae bacterium]|nr:hypothetical protein [Kofleriaceae bacterium]